MAVITRGHHPKASWPGVKRWYGMEYKQYTPIWPQMFERLNSTKQYEEDVEEIGFGLLSTKNEAGAISFDTAVQGVVSRYTHITYGLGFQVTMEELQDNQYEKLSFRRASRLARSVYETEETIHANVFNRAFDSNYTGGDSVQMIASTHPTGDGTQSNVLSTAADMSEASIEDLCIQIANATDSRGLKFSNKPQMLIVPNNLMFEATRIVKSVLQNDTANNATNAIRMMNIFPGGVLVNPYLTDTDAWFIRTDCMDGITHYDRMAATFEQDNDFDTKNARASVVLRFSAGWSNWRQIYGTPGA